MTIDRIGAAAPRALTAHETHETPPQAAKPAPGGGARSGARAAVSGPLAQLAPPSRAGKPGGGGAPRPLRLPPPGLKIAGLPSGGRTAAPAASAAPHAAAPDTDIAAMRASALATMAAQDALARIQNQIALNQAKNGVIEELGKGLKSLAQ